MSKTKLYLGCGPSPIHPQHLEYIDETWIKIDKYVDEPGIVKMDIGKLDYPDESVDEIYCSHTLEHIGLKFVLPTLLEWARVLKPGGRVTINVPDMEWLAEELLRQIKLEKPRSPVFDSQRKLMEVVYGNQDHEGEFHKSGYTVELLVGFLREAGFYLEEDVERVYEAHEMGCLIAKAKKDG